MESPASRWSNTLKADNIKIQQLSIHLPIYLSICLFAYLSSSIYLYNPRYTLADDAAALDDLSQLYTQYTTQDGCSDLSAQSFTRAPLFGQQHGLPSRLFCDVICSFIAFIPSSPSSVQPCR